MVNKKGLSDVITTVLIILLTLAAVVLIWTFLQPTIKNSVSGVQGQSDCLTAQVEPINCMVRLLDKSVNVTVSNKYSKDLNAKVIYNLPNGATKVLDLTGIGAFGSKTGAEWVNDTTVLSVSVAAAIPNTDGTSAVCTPGLNKVTCS